MIKERRLPGFQIKHAAELTKVECITKPTGGSSGFGPAITSLISMRGFDKLKGIAIVTDNDKRGSLASIQKDLAKYGYNVPIPPREIGTFEHIPVVIIPIPDSNHYGDLESLCLPALYAKWPTAEECVESYLRCTGASAWRKQNQIPKAKVRSILSGYYEKEPNIGLGYLFQRGELSVDHECFNNLEGILRRFDEIIERGSF